MYGQGNYAPRFRRRQPPPPFRQASPRHAAPLHPGYQHGPPPHPQIYQDLPGRPPEPYQNASLALPARQPAPVPPPGLVNMGQPFIHQPPLPVHGSALIVPSYAQPCHSYPPSMSSQNAHQIPQQLPPPPRMFPPPPSPSQRQVLCWAPPLPSMGIQHLPTSSCHPPSSFVSMIPAQFLPLRSTSVGDAHSPYVQPPPLPPPSPPPPPLPPSSPPPAPPMAELPTTLRAPSMDSVADRARSVHADAPVTPAQSGNNALASGKLPIGEVDNAGKKVSLAEGELSGDLPPPPPKPIEEDVVRNIEVLCQFIERVGPEFENFVRTKEAENPKFAFLFGGAPGSAAAIGYEYFQWMKKKCHFAMELNKHPDRPSEMENSLPSGNLENVDAASPPAASDMDMEDDAGLPGGDAGINKLKTEVTGESSSLATERDAVEEPAPRNTMELIQRGPMSSTLSCSRPSSFLQDGEGSKDSSLMEDVSLARPFPGAAECAVDDNMQRSVRPLTQDSGWVDVAPAAACGKTTETPRVFVRDGSPFRLLQGYASDDSREVDDKKDSVDNINPVRNSPSTAVGRSGLQKDKGYELPLNFTPKSLPETGRSGLQTDSSHSLSTMPKEASSLGSFSPKKSVLPGVIFPDPVDAIESATDLIIHEQHDQRLHDKTGTCLPSEDNDIVGGKSINVDHQLTEIHSGDGKQDFTAPNVDEFGRLVRGVSDSDSDVMHNNERHGKRVRSLSCSQSPQESKWRRRSCSPRRRDKRSRPYSLSPTRSRRKSPPAYRRTTLFARGDQDQPPECFNYIQGMCFHRASHHFIHRDVGQLRDRQPHNTGIAQDSDNYDGCDNTLASENHNYAMSLVIDMDVEKSIDVNLEETKRAELQIDEKLSEVSTKISHDGALGEKVAFDSVIDDALPSLNNVTGEQQITDQACQDIISQVKEPQQVEILQEAPKIDGVEHERTQPLLESFQSSPSHKSEGLLNETILEQANSEGQTIQVVAFQNQVPSVRPYSEHALVSQTYQSQSSVSHSCSNYDPTGQPWNQRFLINEFPPASLSMPDAKSQPSQLLAPAPQGHPPPFCPVDNITAPSQHPRGDVPPPVGGYFQPPPVDMLASHQPPGASDYHSQSVHSSTTMWSQPPLPVPSHVTKLPSRPVFPATVFQQNPMPPRNDFSQHSVRHYNLVELTRSQKVDFYPQPFQSMESSHHPRLHMDELKQRPLPMRNQQDQPFPAEDCLARPHMPEGSRISLNLQQREYLQHHQSLHDDVRIPFLAQVPSTFNLYSQGSSMHPRFLSNKLPPRFFSREEFPTVSNLPYSHPSYHQQSPANTIFSTNLGGPGMANPFLQSFSSSSSEGNLLPHLSEIGAPKMSISTRYNPFASTFEDTPGRLKFSSSKYDSLFSSRYGPLGGSGSRLTASPLNSTRSGEQFFPRSGDHSHETSAEVLSDVHKQFVRDPASSVPYDPLFDSIEPSSNTLNKPDHVQEQNLAASDEGVVPKINSLTRPIDVEDNNKQKDGASVELPSEVDFGEVATNAQVGAVKNGSPQRVDPKNGSPAIPIEGGNAAAGEIEIDQGQSPGKKKKKELKSTKLLKIAIADFVKEVLKPLWRQGNMSKEAFKTIVKKTVDKVSGAIPSHQIPRTQVKINQYVESSQQKLTKLVMAYVDKYVKV